MDNTTEHPATLTHGPADDLGRPISSATGSADLVLYPLEDLGGLVRTAFRAGDPTRPGLEVCEIAHWLPADERRRLSALIARAPEMAAEIERLRAERDEACFEVETLNEKLDKARADLAAAQAENETALTCYGDRITTLEAEVIGQQEEIADLRAALAAAEQTGR